MAHEDREDLEGQIQDLTMEVQQLQGRIRNQPITTDDFLLTVLEDSLKDTRGLLSWIVDLGEELGSSKYSFDIVLRRLRERGFGSKLTDDNGEKIDGN